MKKQITIDEKHTEMLHLFHMNETVRIPLLKEKMTDLQKKEK